MPRRGGWRAGGTWKVEIYKNVSNAAARTRMAGSAGGLSTPVLLVDLDHASRAHGVRDVVGHVTALPSRLKPFSAIPARSFRTSVFLRRQHRDLGVHALPGLEHLAPPHAVPALLAPAHGRHRPPRPVHVHDRLGKHVLAATRQSSLLRPLIPPCLSGVLPPDSTPQQPVRARSASGRFCGNPGIPPRPRPCKLGGAVSCSRSPDTEPAFSSRSFRLAFLPAGGRFTGVKGDRHYSFRT